MTPNKKILIALAVLLLVVGLTVGIYYTYFQFNQKDVKDYINEEVSTYKSKEQAAVYKIIADGVAHILADKSLTKQVLAEAERNGTPKEMELVHAAIMQAKSFSYLD